MFFVKAHRLSIFKQPINQSVRFESTKDFNEEGKCLNLESKILLFLVLIRLGILGN